MLVPLYSTYTVRNFDHMVARKLALTLFEPFELSDFIYLDSYCTVLYQYDCTIAVGVPKNSHESLHIIQLRGYFN
jgi:hypothetical protein